MKVYHTSQMPAMSHDYLPQVIPPQFRVGEAETLCDSHENYRVLNR